MKLDWAFFVKCCCWTTWLRPHNSNLLNLTSLGLSAWPWNLTKLTILAQTDCFVAMVRSKRLVVKCHVAAVLLLVPFLNAVSFFQSFAFVGRAVDMLSREKPRHRPMRRSRRKLYDPYILGWPRGAWSLQSIWLQSAWEKAVAKFNSVEATDRFFNVTVLKMTIWGASVLTEEGLVGLIPNRDLGEKAGDPGMVGTNLTVLATQMEEDSPIQFATYINQAFKKVQCRWCGWSKDCELYSKFDGLWAWWRCLRHEEGGHLQLQKTMGTDRHLRHGWED